MPEVNWQIIAALIGGGAMGTIIKIVYDALRNRIPQVGRRVDILPIFVPADDDSELKATVTLVHNDETTAYQNLYIAEVAVVNRSHQDFAEFQFMVELDSGDRCVFVSSRTPDASHELKLIEPVSPEKPSSLLKIALKPFNRRDRYEAKLYLVIPEAATRPNELRFSSSFAVRFIDMVAVTEMLPEVSSFVIKFGPAMISIRR